MEYQKELHITAPFFVILNEVNDLSPHTVSAHYAWQAVQVFPIGGL